MAATTTREPRSTPIQQGLPPSFKREGVVYAVTFDMDIAQLRLHYGDPYNNACVEIRRVLEGHGFVWQQGSVYFGNAAVTSATVMVAAIDLTTRLPWFAACIRDMRMLRIEELNDLMPVVQRVAGLTSDFALDGRQRGSRMAANIYVYCPPGSTGLSRCDLEEELEAFFGGAAEDCGAGSGIKGFNLDYELAKGEDPQAWADRLREHLRKLDVIPGTSFEVFADGWEPGMPWRRVDIGGEDRWLTKRE